MTAFNDSYAEEKEVFEKKFQKLVNLIEHSHRMTVFTGAGVSTLSGIPDFRGKHGVYNDPWQGMDVEEIISMTFFRREQSFLKAALAAIKSVQKRDCP